MYLGNDSFIEKIQSINKNIENDGDLKEVPRMQSRTIAKNLEWYENQFGNRHEVMAYAFFQEFTQ
ncbi:MAG: hypothetical protein L3J75_01430 [Methylococcaceae bacterium]|nr:hypothetical protein [Methylococcaceae bacterium]